MPVSMKGLVAYVTNNDASGDLTHGQPVKEGNFVGVAIKTKAIGWGDAVASAALIADGEDYTMLREGVVEVDQLAGAAQGDKLYIDGSNVLTEVATSNTKYGRVLDVENTRGLPAGRMRVDLDAKDSF